MIILTKPGTHGNLKVLNKYAPVRTFRPRKNELPWIDEDIEELM